MDGKMEDRENIGDAKGKRIKIYIDLVFEGEGKKEVEMSSNIKIRDIKEYLCGLFPEELDINTLHLVANGYGLPDDEATLEEYEIEDGTIIEVYPW